MRERRGKERTKKLQEIDCRNHSARPSVHGLSSKPDDHPKKKLNTANLTGRWIDLINKKSIKQNQNNNYNHQHHNYYQQQQPTNRSIDRLFLGIRSNRGKQVVVIIVVVVV